MIKRIKALQAQAASLEPSPEEFKELLAQTSEHLTRFLSNNDSDPVFFPKMPDHDTRENYEDPQAFEKVLDSLNAINYDIGLRPSSPGYLSFIPGGGQVHAAIADLITSVTNKYAGVHFGAPGAVRIENDLIAWNAEMVGYDPKKAGGSLASGGSIANLTALVCARDALLGQNQFHQAKIYTSSHAHHCLHKALRIMGMRGNKIGEEGQIHYIETDDNFCMKPDVLRAAIEEDRENGFIPWLIIGNAGATNFGNIDPIDALADIAEQEKMWLHIDGAYGAYFLLTKEGKAKMKGIERSDSIVMDAHKSMFLPYGLGAVVVKDRELLFNSFHYNADYLTADEHEKYSPANLSPELTKPFRGLRLWLPLKVLGLAPFRAALEEKLLLTKYIYQKIQALPNFEIINAPDLTVFAFRVVFPKMKGNEAAINAYNKKLHLKIKHDGRVYLSPTSYRPKNAKEPRYVIRIAILSFRTHLERVDACLEMLKELTLTPDSK